MGTNFFWKCDISIIDLFESYLFKNNKHNYKQTNTRNIKKLDPDNWEVECQYID